MKSRIFLVFTMGCLVFGLACTNAADPPVRVANAAPAAEKQAPAAQKVDEHGHDDGKDAPRISLADAKKAYDAGTAVIVDVRDQAAYQFEHIKGAVHIPAAELNAKADTLPKGKKIIAYCS